MIFMDRAVSTPSMVAISGGTKPTDVTHRDADESKVRLIRGEIKLRNTQRTPLK